MTGRELRDHMTALENLGATMSAIDMLLAKNKICVILSEELRTQLGRLQDPLNRAYTEHYKAVMAAACGEGADSIALTR